MTTTKTIALSILALIALTVALTAYLFGQRYQVSATNDAVFIVDTFTGDIEAYMVGRKGGNSYEDLTVYKVGASE